MFALIIMAKVFLLASIRSSIGPCKHAIYPILLQMTKRNSDISLDVGQVMYLIIIFVNISEEARFMFVELHYGLLGEVVDEVLVIDNRLVFIVTNTVD